ncbi:MAG: solute:sodium symporter family transporter [Planctomycetota bacterium]
MQFTPVDYVAFIGYIVVVVAFAMYMSRREESSEDYFLAGRKLTWWLIGISLIASNISTEHFVGMAGAGYSTGLAIASYEWMAAVAIVLVAIFLLPKFLRRGIYTIPEFLEHRYGSGARGLMAFFMLAAYVFVIISAVLYAGAIGLDAVFGDAVRQYVERANVQEHVDLSGMLGDQWLLILSVWLIGIIAGLYTVWGGLKAVVWADLFNGLGLILGGIVVTVLGFLALSDTLGQGGGLVEGVNIFWERAGDKLSSVKPWNDPEVPWIAVFIGGLWIPQLFYWGLNQFITQRALGAKSVAEGQKGMMFAASLKLLMPFIIIFPGIMAFELFAGEIPDKDKAYPHMIQTILPAGLRGLMLAALFGAVMSSLDSMLNSASTIFTMDLYKRHLNQKASDRSLIRLGQAMTAVFVVVACLWAPQLGWIAGGNGVFDYIQKTWGFITPGIAAVFFFGLFSRRTPSRAAIGAMLLGPAFYMWCLKVMPQVAFLHHMAFTFIALSVYMFAVTMLTPLRDVEAASVDAVQIDRPTGLLRNTLIPFGTAILGAYLFGLALFQFSWVTSVEVERFWEIQRVPEWIHYVTTGVPTAIYFVAALYLMRLPAPSTRLVVAPSAAGPKRRLLPGLMVRKAAVVGAVVVGLHAYLFCLWVIPEAPVEDYWQGYDVKLSAIGTGEPVVSKKVISEKDIAGDAAAPVEAFDLATHERAAEAAQAMLAEEKRRQEEIITVYFTPLLIALVAAVACLVGVEMSWRTRAAPGVEAEATTKLDLTPSPWVKVWGLMVILATALLYCAFF